MFRVALTGPSQANLAVIACGWILSQGPRAVTEALLRTGVAGELHDEAFHRFFSRGTWDPDALGYWLFQRVRPLLGDGAVRIVIDDTSAPKKGPHVFGLGTHVDPVNSTKKHRAFRFGHCWVVLSVSVTVPFSRRPWALPVLFRLYRNLEECTKNDAACAK